MCCCYDHFENSVTVSSKVRQAPAHDPAMSPKALAREMEQASIKLLVSLRLAHTGAAPSTTGLQPRQGGLTLFAVSEPGLLFVLSREESCGASTAPCSPWRPERAAAPPGASPSPPSAPPTLPRQKPGKQGCSQGSPALSLCRSSGLRRVTWEGPTPHSPLPGPSLCYWLSC